MKYVCLTPIRHDEAYFAEGETVEGSVFGEGLTQLLARVPPVLAEAPPAPKPAEKPAPAPFGKK